MSRIPIVRSVAWISLVPHLAVMAALVGLVRLFSGVGWFGAIYVGTGLFLVYSLGSRSVLAREHKAGIRRAKQGDFAGSIPHYERSYAFFEKHAWLDRWRYLTMLTSGKASYREMALVNIAFSYSQIGQGRQAEETYRRALSEFPDSVMARAGLQMAETFKGAL